MSRLCAAVDMFITQHLKEMKFRNCLALPATGIQSGIHSVDAFLVKEGIHSVRRHGIRLLIPDYLPAVLAKSLKSYKWPVPMSRCNADFRLDPNRSLRILPSSNLGLNVSPEDLSLPQLFPSVQTMTLAHLFPDMEVETPEEWSRLFPMMMREAFEACGALLRSEARPAAAGFHMTE